MKSQIKAKKKCEKLLRKCHMMTLTTININGIPNSREMLKADAEGLNKIWFTTNTSSRKVKEIIENSNACVYIFTRIPFRGVTIQGKISIITDMEEKRNKWKNSYKEFYKKGVTDPDYTLLLFETENISYYFNQKIEIFNVQDLI